MDGAAGRYDDPRADDADARGDAVALVGCVAGRCEREGRCERDDDGAEQDAGGHGILLNQMPESRPPASMNASPPAAATAVTSTRFDSLPTREPSSAYVPAGSKETTCG